MSAASARVVYVQPVSGFSPERSDPYVEWAIRFEQGLRRAEDRIRAWSRDAASLADDDLEAPPREAIVRAFELIDELKERVMDRVAPSNATLMNFKGASLGTGGEISFEFVTGSLAVTYRIEPDGTVTKLLFQNNKLIHREHPAR